MLAHGVSSGEDQVDGGEVNRYPEISGVKHRDERERRRQ